MGVLYKYSSLFELLFMCNEGFETAFSCAMEFHVQATPRRKRGQKKLVGPNSVGEVGRSALASRLSSI